MARQSSILSILTEGLCARAFWASLSLNTLPRLKSTSPKALLRADERNALRIGYFMVHGMVIIHSTYYNWRICALEPCNRFINPNASSPKIDLYLSIVRWRRICIGHRIFYGTWLDNHPFYLCQLKDSWAQVRASSFLWFYWCCAQNQKIELQLSVERELLPENSVFFDISTIKVCMARKHSPRIPKERFRPAPAAAVVLNQLQITEIIFPISAVPSSSTWPEI